MVDLVPNHTSAHHRWFQEALAAEPGSAARDRYIFRDGKGPDGAEPPTNWTSVFGGPAWTRVDDGQWYLHLFEVTQPDLNWRNPEIRDEFLAILRFWLDRGVDGFRVDVAHGLMKDWTFPDVEASTRVLGSTKDGNHPHWDRDEVHDVYRTWRAVLDEYGADRMMVAEAWVHQSRLPLYVRPDEYHQSFDFDMLQAEWDAEQFRSIAEGSIAGAEAVGSAPTWVLSNHDVVRHATRYGLPTGTDWRTWVLDGPHDELDVDTGLRRARAATLLMLALPGAAYLYQGEELGLGEVWDLPTEVLDDPVWRMSEHTVKGRDGCRVPIPWTAEGDSFGFGGPDPWLPMPDRFGPLAADQQAGDPASTLELYRAALRLRREHLVADASIQWLDAGDDVVAFRRGHVTCTVNLGTETVELPTGEVLLRSDHDGPTGELPPDTAAWTHTP